MIITCPSCATQFRVPDGALGAEGRKLRCSSCRHVWFQMPPAADAAEAETAPPAAPVPVAAAPAAEEPVRAEASPPDAGEATGEDPQAEADASTEATAEPPAPAPEEPPAETIAQESAPDAADEVEPAPVASAPQEETVSEAPVEPEADAGPAPEEEPAEEAPAAPRETASTGTVGWEPGAVMPRSVKREPTPEPAKPGLRLVAQEKPVEDKTGDAAAPAQPRTEPATPSYDVTRVVTPDSAPEAESRKAPRKRRSGLVLFLLILVAVVGAAYFERTQVMRFVPQTATLYGMIGLVGAPGSQGLQLHDVAFRVEEVGGTPSLIVSGSVINVGRDYRRLPALHVMLLDDAMQPLEVWTLHAMADGLAPGATTLFEAVYADPPHTGSEESLFVTFADLM